MNLTNAAIIGFFSLPSAALAEANPSAYSTAMASAPAGAGCCAHCGRGILHHVVIRTAEGKTAFIGQDCAMRVGEERLRRGVRLRKTDEEMAADEAKRTEAMRKDAEEADANRIATLERWAANEDLIFWLIGEDEALLWAEDFRSGRSDYRGRLAADCFSSRISANRFPDAMAIALIQGREFTPNMAAATAKMLLGRRTKKNGAEWDALFSRLCPGYSEEG